MTRYTPVRTSLRPNEGSTKGIVITLDDGYRWRKGYKGQTIEAVKVTILELKRQGYAFVSADELIGVPAYAKVRLWK
jgi:hypothetical protein